MTPDRVETRLGTLEFDDGRPAPDTVTRLYDFVDLMRGVQVSSTAFPARWRHAVRLVEHGIGACHQVFFSEELLDSIRCS